MPGDVTKGLEKISRLKGLRRDVAERAYRAAVLEVSIARRAKDAAEGHLADRENNGTRERRENLARIFEGDKERTPVHAHIAVAAWLRTSHEIRAAKDAVDRAGVVVMAHEAVAATKRLAFAAAEREAHKIDLVRERLSKDRLRKS